MKEKLFYLQTFELKYLNILKFKILLDEEKLGEVEGNSDDSDEPN